MKVPKHIEIRDKTGKRTAYLAPKADGLKDCYIDQRLYAENTLVFLLPMDSTKWAELTAECKIIAGGREYVILKPNSIEIERDNQNKLLGRVAAAESWILLDKVYPTISNDPQNPDPPDLTVSIISGGTPATGQLAGTAGNALTYLLAGTGWTLDICDVEGIHDLEGEKLSALAYIRRVQETWGGLLIWDSLNKKLSLRSEEWQPFNGFQVRYAKNLRHITKSVDNDIVTRLYPFGENDLDIATVNDGVKYLESFSFTNTVYEGIFRDQTIHEPADLKAAAEKVLHKLCRPRNTYRVRVADLRMLAEYRHESFALAHMADVVDEEVAGTTRVRIVRHRYNVFEPWNCELEIGDPEDRLDARLADSFDVSSKVKTNVLPNPSFASLLKGVIDTYTTTINGARGRLVWYGDRIDLIDVDEQGVETGKIVRLTPGGVGISDDFGQTFQTAMTGAGVVADQITTGNLLTSLVTIASSDGLVNLVNNGLHVFDEDSLLRVIAGWWHEDGQKQYGTKIIAKDGSTVLLDNRGILQTWQEGRADNVQNGFPLTLNVFVPEETRSIRRALLRFRLLPFRAYSSGAASGGGAAVTSATSDEVSQTSATSSLWDMYAIYVLEATDVQGGHSHGGTGSALVAGHNHGISSGTDLAVAGGGSVTYLSYGGDSHAHSISSDGSHAHALTSDHKHDVTLPGHAHTVNVPAHSHGLLFGIYTGTSATGVTVTINGVNRTAALGGPFIIDRADLDIASYLIAGQWNTIQLGSTQLGRLDATIFLQALMGV